jgi:hypothetical protein
MGDKTSRLSNTVLGGVVLLLTAIGWLFLELSPNDGTLLTAAVNVVTLLLVVGFGAYILIKAYSNAVPEFDTPANSGTEAAVSEQYELNPDESVLTRAGPKDVARLLRAARPLPAFVVLALLPLLFPWEGRLSVPVFGVIPFPWYAFPTTSLLMCIGFYWILSKLRPLPLIRGK